MDLLFVVISFLAFVGAIYWTSRRVWSGVG